MTEFNAIKTLEELSKTGPVFHSESDFQFALEWKIQKQDPDAEIRLEYKVPGFSPSIIIIRASQVEEL